MQIHPFPLCCGIAIICGFGNDPRHAARDARRGHNDQTLEDIESGLERIAVQAVETGLVAHNGAPLGRVGMLLLAVNIPQRTAMAPLLRRLGWRKAGRADNLHAGNGVSDVFLYRKVLADATTQD